MQLVIDRIPADRLSPDVFFERYYLPEKPLLLSGVEIPGERPFLSLVENPQAKCRNGNLSLPMSATSGVSPCLGESSDLPVPKLVQMVFARTDIVQRPLPVRAWLHPKGYRTPLHFDGNSLHGLNLLVQGRKRWTLISPDTPTRLMPLTYFAMTRRDFEPDPRKHDFYQFETTPGDMLFLPRYWLHAVDAIAETNANLNWVWTPRQPNPRVFVGRRECAILRLKDLLPPLDRIPHYRIPVRNYADGDQTLFRDYSRAVGGAQLVGTLLRELSRFCALPLFYRSVAEQIQELEHHTFRVEDESRPGET
jgi:hypothetical protein